MHVKIFWAPIIFHVALKMYRNRARPKITCSVMCCNVNGIIKEVGLDQLFWPSPRYIEQLFLRGKLEKPSKEMAQKNTRPKKLSKGIGKET